VDVVAAVAAIALVVVASEVVVGRMMAWQWRR